MATLQDQLDHAEQFYDDNVIFQPNGGLWQSQLRFFNVDNNNNTYAQLLPSHNTNPFHTEQAVGNGDKVMERPSDSPDYDDRMRWDQMCPWLLPPVLLPANMWVHQWVARTGKGYTVYLELDYTGRDISPTPQTWQMNIIYDGTDRGKKSGWYQPPAPIDLGTPAQQLARFLHEEQGWDALLLEDDILKLTRHTDAGDEEYAITWRRIQRRELDTLPGPLKADILRWLDERFNG